MGSGSGRPSIRLTKRDLEVLALVADGKTDAEIAMILGISAGTVNWRVEDIKRRFGVSTRIQAVVIALRRGFLY